MASRRMTVRTCGLQSVHLASRAQTDGLPNSGPLNFMKVLGWPCGSSTKASQSRLDYSKRPHPTSGEFSTVNHHICSPLPLAQHIIPPSLEISQYDSLNAIVCKPLSTSGQRATCIPVLCPSITRSPPFVREDIDYHNHPARWRRPCSSWT